MLVFAGLVPHSPLLMESVNPDRLHEAAKTLAALEELSDEIYAAKPETIVILAESTTMYPEAFSVNVADPYAADLSSVGDLGYHKKYDPDFGFIDALQRFARQNTIPVSLSTDELLTFQTVIPLHFLSRHFKDIRIVPIAPCSLDGKAHFSFGSTLKHLVLESPKRIAVIAAGDMSHGDESAFDERLVTIMKEKNGSGLLQMDPDAIAAAKDTSYRQIAMLFGVLDGIDATPEVLSYEKPFGTGFAVVNFLM